MIYSDLKKKPTITIGIPAHNEAENIIFLLKSIFDQKMEFFDLEKVIVVCDGCTDDTEQKVLEFSKQNTIVKPMNDGLRKGKTNRLNELYQMNQSDFILTFDGDIVLTQENDIEEMAKQFDDKNVLVVGAHEEPVKPEKGLIANIIYTSYILWDEVRGSINNGDHIANLYGSATMLRKSFAESLIYPPMITADEEYLYAAVKKKNGFKYARNTRIFYRSASTIQEWRWQVARFSNERYALKKYFGEGIIQLHSIPIKYKIRAIMIMLVSSPGYTVLAIMLNLWLRVFPKEDKLNQKGMWKVIKSTKKGIDRNEIGDKKNYFFSKFFK